MKSIVFDPTKPGFVSIPGTTRKVVAHFKDGNKEAMDIMELLTMKPRKINQVNKIDCYTESEEVPV